MFDLTNPHQNFKTYDDHDVLICHWTLDLIKRQYQQVWVMNHLFINPQVDFNKQLAEEMETLKIFGQESGHLIWPLDPAVIEYFKNHQAFHKFWYHHPFGK